VGPIVLRTQEKLRNDPVTCAPATLTASPASAGQIGYVATRFMNCRHAQGNATISCHHDATSESAPKAPTCGAACTLAHYLAPAAAQWKLNRSVHCQQLTSRTALHVPYVRVVLISVITHPETFHTRSQGQAKLAGRKMWVDAMMVVVSSTKVQQQ
jgi:hypothetical protein